MVHDNPVGLQTCRAQNCNNARARSTLSSSSACVSTEELPDGHQFRLAGDREGLALIADLIGWNVSAVRF